jgi:hypothetical protein
MIEEEPFLFPELTRAWARNSDPDTSHAAAIALGRRKINALERMVLRALWDSVDGLTNHEIVERTGLSWNTATPRVHPLVIKGLVKDSGRRRAGPSGKSCIVWEPV